MTTYRGTSQVKDTNVDVLVQKYETFRIEENEAIEDMFKIQQFHQPPQINGKDLVK